VTLSGGQKQRLAIARALLLDAPILVLDDALSAVDAHTEQQILLALKVHKRTLVLVSHRMTAVEQADEILVLEQGAISERGRHETLMARTAGTRTWSATSAWSRTWRRACEQDDKAPGFTPPPGSRERRGEQRESIPWNVALEAACEPTIKRLLAYCASYPRWLVQAGICLLLATGAEWRSLAHQALHR
jgi:ABC-type glutathione transport system ATPase component